ncbi:MAG: hypothetical protein QM705_15240 [Ancrocorticia sp.]
MKRADKEEPGISSDTASLLEQRVRAELLTARKSSEGLSPNSMARCLTLTALLGDGDPRVAFTQLQTRILETIDQDDDVTPILAASYSLGFASKGTTHLDRLTDFGEDYGYEARQARRHSDKGINELTRLICSNWLLHTVPTAEVTVVGQPDGTFLLMVRTKQQWFVDMHEFTIRRQTEYGLELWTPQPEFIDAPQPEDSYESEQPNTARETAWVVKQLCQPIQLPVPQKESPVAIRLDWQGEVWPRWSLRVMGRWDGGTIVESRTIGASVVLAVERPFV